MVGRSSAFDALLLNIAFVMSLLLVANPFAEAATMSCPQMTLEVVPCFGYVVTGGEVPAACCSGLKAVKAATPTRELCRGACACLQKTAALIPGVNYDLVNTLPEKCNVSVPFKLTPSTDCSKVD